MNAIKLLLINAILLSTTSTYSSHGVRILFEHIARRAAHSSPPKPAQSSHVHDSKAQKEVHTPSYVEKFCKKGFANLGGALPPEFKETLDFIKNNQRYKSIGATIPKGLLLVGPPGTGKTAYARALAEEAECPFFAVSMTEFQQPLVGVGAQSIRISFEHARKAALKSEQKAAMIFIDEIDIAGSRTDNSIIGSTHDELTELLNQMDGFVVHDKAYLLVIAATNMAAKLDPALMRPGRFDRIIRLSLPNKESRKDILLLYASRTKHDATDIDFDLLAQQTPGYSPAELKNLVNEAAILAVRNNQTCIKMCHYKQAFESLEKRKEAIKQRLVDTSEDVEEHRLKSYLI